MRTADLVLIPVATSHVDLWAVDVVLYMAEREKKPTLMVLTRGRPGTRLAAEISAANRLAACFLLESSTIQHYDKQ